MGRCPGSWVSGGLTDGSKGPVLDHELSTVGKVAKAQILQFFLPCLEAVVGKEDDGRVVPAKMGEWACQGFKFLFREQLAPVTLAGASDFWPVSVPAHYVTCFKPLLSGPPCMCTEVSSQVS